MYETYASIRDTLALDADITSKGGVVALSIDNIRERQAKCNAATFPIHIYPFGVSQTAGAGTLNTNGYFAVTVQLRDLQRTTNRGSDFLAIGERIIALLHRSRHAGESVILSKNIIAHSSFVLENSNRRINVKVEAGEMVQVLFFWTNAASVEALAAASSATDSAASASGVSRTASAASSSATETETPDTDAVNAVAAAYELFP